MSESTDPEAARRKAREFFGRYVGRDVLDKYLENNSKSLSAYGYSVWQGDRRNDEERRHALRQRAIPKLGLQAVAETLAGLIRWKRNRNESYYSNAINAWERDLKWLKQEFYIKNRGKYHFSWPRV